MSWKDILRKRFSSKKSDKDSNVEPRYSGIETQFEAVAEGSHPVQLVCGLDFGTAFTKFVIGEERKSYAVPWRNDPHSIHQYLLPSTFWMNDAGDCSLDDVSGTAIIDMKMRLLTGENDDELGYQMCAFMALVFRRARGFILNEKEAIYKNNKIIWMINIGLPTDSYHNDELTSLYHSIAHTAWNISQEDRPINIEMIAQRMRNDQWGENVQSLSSDTIGVFPEFVAQVTGYVRSPLRQPDLHLLVDVGAGTLDATVFNVHKKDGEDWFPIFAKSVEPLGSRFLIKHRIQGTDLKEKGELGPFASVPLKKRFSSLLNISTSEIDAIDKSFKNKVLKQITQLLDYTKTKRYTISKRWEEGVPLLFCGGGSHCEFYKELLRSAASFGAHPIQHRSLPKPDKLEAPGITSMDYDRISVAYGLSFDAFDIGEIEKMEEIKDIDEDSESEEKPRSWFCSKCGGTGGLHRPCPDCGGSGISKD